MKRGANYSQQNQIRRLISEGYDLSTISTLLEIELTCVESFAERFFPTQEEVQPKKVKAKKKKD